MATAFFSQSFLIPKPTLTEENLPDQTGKVHIVTGGYAGVGYELTGILYSKGATVYVAGRSKDKADKSMAEIREKHPSSKGRLEFLSVDLSDLTTIKPSVQEFLSREKRLDVLVNNAGVMFPPNGSKGKQGHELQMVTNCLGPFLFTKGLMPVLESTAKQVNSPGSVRVIWASSLGANMISPKDGVLFTDAGEPQNSTNNQVNYGQTKAGNNLYAAEIHRRYGDKGILSVAFNPGNLKSELQRHVNPIANLVMWAILHPAVYGAYTELFSGWSKDLTMANGGDWIVPWGQVATNQLRADVKKSVETGKTSADGVSTKFWDWSEKETAKYA